MKNVVRISKKLLFITICLWITIATLRTFYNISKLYTEERKWLALSDDQQRVALFGDIYRAIKIIQEKTPGSAQILSLSPGGKTFFLSRYYLYPRKITYIKSTSEVAMAIKKNTFDYLVVFQTSEKDLDENNSLSWRLNYHPLVIFSNFKDRSAVLTIYKL